METLRYKRFMTQKHVFKTKTRLTYGAVKSKEKKANIKHRLGQGTTRNENDVVFKTESRINRETESFQPL